MVQVQYLHFNLNKRIQIFAEGCMTHDQSLKKLSKLCIATFSIEENWLKADYIRVNMWELQQHSSCIKP